MVDAGGLRIGIVADTHVPDRMDALHPRLLEMLAERRVSLILHAGDISGVGVLEALRQVAPVEAAFGNRDLVFGDRLPMVNHLVIGGVKLALMHGHGGWTRYFLDKWVYVAQGYRFERYAGLVQREAGDARVIVFGHTHHAEQVWIGDQLLFNPGAASRGFRKDELPSFGLLEIGSGGEVSGEIIRLEGYRIENGRWRKNA